MTRATVKLKTESGEEYVSLCLTIGKSEKFELTGQVRQASGRIVLHDGTVCSPDAVQSAAFSGAIFALSLLRQNGKYPQCVINIEEVDGRLSTGDLEKCAAASLIAISYATGSMDIMTKAELDNWKIEEIHMSNDVANVGGGNIGIDEIG